MKAYKERKSMDTHSSDPEAHEMEESRRNDRPLDLNHYRIVDEVWHFCSVDWGSKCEALSGYRESLAKSGQIYVSVIIPSTIQRPRRRTLLLRMGLYQRCHTEQGCGPG